MFERHLNLRIESLARRMDLPLRLELWDGTAIRFGPAPSVASRLRRPRLLEMLCRGDVDGLGQAYVEGDLDIEGKLQDVLAIGIALAEKLGRLAPIARLIRLLPRPRRRHSKDADARWIAYHCDVSNGFYALWLAGI